MSVVPCWATSANTKTPKKRRHRKSSHHQANAPWPRWGPLELDTPQAAVAHCCAIGPRRHGIDTLLSILMTSVNNCRWLVYDGWNDLLPTIYAIRASTRFES